jgi:hypothetical protein
MLFILLVARQKPAEEFATSRILRREQHLREALRSDSPQIIEPFFCDQIEIPLFRLELAVRELIFPFNEYGIAPEFVTSNDLDPNAAFHLSSVMMISVSFHSPQMDSAISIARES